jgi:hypothetical protein
MMRRQMVVDRCREHSVPRVEEIDEEEEKGGQEGELKSGSNLEALASFLRIHVKEKAYYSSCHGAPGVAVAAVTALFVPAQSFSGVLSGSAK